MFWMNFRRSVKGAYKSVKSNFKEYICFFVALMMVETLFGVVTAAYKNNSVVEYTLIKEAGYTYHAQLTGITDTDLNILNDAYADGVGQDAVFFEYKIENGRCLVRFMGDLKKARTTFVTDVLSQINAGQERVMLSVSPLYDYEVEKGADMPVFLLILGVFMLLSFLLLMALFRIRINHFKFTYSIYMAFGGDFKKLVGSAFYEILLLALFSFPAAALLTYGIAALLYLPFGQPFCFTLLPLPVMLLCTLVPAVLALLLPMRALASGIPVKHMKAQDNSNFVSSPRKSKLFLKKTPFYIEGWALWRFRGYVAVLLLSTVSFAALFNVGCYLADVYTVRSKTVDADLSLSFISSERAEDYTGYFENRAKHYGIGTYVLEKTAVNPYADLGENSPVLPPHLVISSERAISSKFVSHPRKSGYDATFALEIRAMDGDALKCMESIYAYRYTGDPSRLLSDPSSIVVSSSLANAKGNTLMVGDVVYLPVDTFLISNEETENLGKDGGTREESSKIYTAEMQLEQRIFVYRAFTVAAVVENYSDYDSMLVYLPVCESEKETSGYEAVIGQAPDYAEINVYLSNAEDRDVVSSFTQTYINSVGGVSAKLDYGKLSVGIIEGQNYRGMILVISLLVFMISPVAGFFSQILFYKKRQLEFDVLRAVGAAGKDLKKVFFVDGVVFSVLSGIVYTIMSVGAVFLLCAVLNTPYIFALFGSATRASSFSPSVPVIPFILGLLLTMLFAAGEVALCYLLYKRKSGDHVAADFAVAEEK